MGMAATRRLRTSDYLSSAFGLGIVLTVLVVMDPRVSVKLNRTFYPSPAEKLLSIGERMADLGKAALLALREQSIDNGPMLVMTVVGILLVCFMVRT
jgi:hypothetical protein